MGITYKKVVMSSTKGHENMINKLITINLMDGEKTIGVYNVRVLVETGGKQNGLVLGSYISFDTNINVAYSSVFVKKPKRDLAVLNVINVYERGQGLLNDKLNTTIIEKTEIA